MVTVAVVEVALVVQGAGSRGWLCQRGGGQRSCSAPWLPVAFSRRRLRRRPVEAITEAVEAEAVEAVEAVEGARRRRPTVATAARGATVTAAVAATAEAAEVAAG
jgi:hypothetical protein